MPLNEMNLRPTFNVPILVCFCYFSYVAPEYANTGMLNEKSDIYSFGVLLLEAVTGRDPVDYGRPANEVICLFNTLLVLIMMERLGIYLWELCMHVY